MTPDIEIRAFTLRNTLARESMVVFLLHCLQRQDCTCHKFSLEFPTEKALYNGLRGHPEQIDGYTDWKLVLGQLSYTRIPSISYSKRN